MSENEKNIPDMPVSDNQVQTAADTSSPITNDPQGSEKIDPARQAGTAVSKNNTSPPVKKTMSRKMRHALLSGGITLLVLVCFVLVNLIAGTLTDKFSALTADVTSNKSFALTEQSVNIAKAVSKKVTVTFLSERSAYIAIDPYCKQTAFMAEEMEKYSEGMIEVRYVDIVRNPTFVEQYPSETLSTTDIIIACGDNSRILTVSDLYHFETYSDSYQYIASSEAETALDNAIVSVTTEELTNVVLITDNCSQDYSYFVKTLNSSGYHVSELSLNASDIPSDTDMVLIYAPAQDYTETAVEKLRSFLKNDGKYGKSLLFAADSQDVSTPHLDALLSEYGMELEHGFAFEADSSRINSSSSNFYDGIMCQFFSDRYTSLLKASHPLITGYSRPISILNAEVAQPLLSYSDYSGLCPFDADDSWDVSSAITGNTFVLAEGRQGSVDNPSVLVVSGTYRVFTKSYYGSAYSNQKYFSTLLASVNHREASHVTLADKVISQFDINISQQTAANLGFVVYALIPILILGVGFTVFLLRRHK